jgi:hypothetical protein
MYLQTLRELGILEEAMSFGTRKACTTYAPPLSSCSIPMAGPTFGFGAAGEGFFVLVGSADLQSELPVITSNNVLDDLGTSNPRQENGRQASHATGWNVGH